MNRVDAPREGSVRFGPLSLESQGRLCRQLDIWIEKDFYQGYMTYDVFGEFVHVYCPEDADWVAEKVSQLFGINHSIYLLRSLEDYITNRHCRFKIYDHVNGCLWMDVTGTSFRFPVSAVDMSDQIEVCWDAAHFMPEIAKHLHELSQGNATIPFGGTRPNPTPDTGRGLEMPHMVWGT